MLSRYQREQLESLFRRAVALRVNPAGGPAPCEMGCGNLGTQAHHSVLRSQEPALRLFYEPRFALWLCGVCHGNAHAGPKSFLIGAMEILRRANPSKADCLTIYNERHDRIKAPEVSWRWMHDYLERCIRQQQKRWADTYLMDALPPYEVDV
jgi:hypothetical protein